MSLSRRLFPEGVRTGLWLLLDPDSHEASELASIARSGQTAGADVILIGGSFITHDGFDGAVQAVKSVVTCPVILFPGNSRQLSPNADGILFTTLLSGRNPQYLIGEQVMAAPVVRQFNLPHLPTAYLLIESGSVTSAEFVSDTKPLPRDKHKLAAAHAIAAELLGLRAVYLEAGSGAKLPVPPDLVRAVAQNISIPVIVGGGVNSPEIALKAAEAGAKAVVVGTAVERGGVQVLKEIAEALTALNSNG